MDESSRLSRLLRLLPIALLVAAITACAPACEAVNDWTWGVCYADIHGSDAPSVHSEIETPPSRDYAEAVDEARPLIHTYIVQQNLPGLSLAISVDGEIVWAEGFGWADIDARRPVTPATRFRIGGVAQTMTAAAVGLLMERGKVDIDLPARDYVPAYPEKAWSFSTRELMGHVAGLSHYGEYEEMLYLDSRCTGPLDAIELYGNDRLLFEPSTEFRYSGYGWMLVGAVVEVAAGEPFFSFMQREIFDTAGMDDTILDDPAFPGTETTSFYWPFSAVDTTNGIEHSNNPDNTCLQGVAALLSTPSDVVRFGDAILQGQLLQAETLNLLRTPVELTTGERTGNGLGWSLSRIRIGSPEDSTTAYGQNAISAGGTTSFLTVPEHDLAIAVTANVSHARNLSSLSARLVEIFVND